MYEQRIYKNEKGAAAMVISKMLHDARDYRDSAKPVTMFLDLAVTEDKPEDPSAWWRTVLSVSCDTRELDIPAFRKAMADRLCEAWCKLSGDYIELSAVYR